MTGAISYSRKIQGDTTCPTTKVSGEVRQTKKRWSYQETTEQRARDLMRANWTQGIAADCVELELIQKLKRTLCTCQFRQLNLCQLGGCAQSLKMLFNVGSGYSSVHRPK